MPYVKLAKLAGVVGGLCWLFQAAINQYDAAGAAVNAMFWGGAALIAVALVGMGAALVSAAPALRVLVGLCVPVLVFSILSALRGEAASENVIDGGFGLVLALVCAASLLGGSAIEEPSRGGSHAK